MIHPLDNPFETKRLERVLAYDPAWAATSWPELDARLTQLGNRACILGEHGAGKTTLVDGLASFLEGVDSAPRVQLFFNEQKRSLLPQERHLLRNLRGRRLFVDGDAHLHWWFRGYLWLAARGAKSFVACRHRPGRLPILIRLTADISLLRNCVRRAAPEYYATLEPKLEGWFRERNGNIREVMGDCYDYVSLRPAPVPPSCALV